MKTKLKILTPAVIAACLALPLFAEEHNKKDKKEPTPGYPVSASPYSSESRSYQSSTEPFGVVTKAKGVIDLEVRNNEDQKLGKVEDVAVSFSSGRVVAVIVSVGGVAGIGDTLIAVPPSEFHHDVEKKVLHLNRTKEELKNAPKVDLAKWDEFQQPANLNEVYRYYGGKSYAPADSTAADTSSRGYRVEGRPTVFQQGNNKSDLDLTANIRKELLRRDDLSVAAQNVTVISLDGKVVLQGKVNSTDERNAIGEIAQQMASPGNVNNQLELSTTVNK
jgi:sporulation protein YlmC with PRC-barrel domain